MNADVISKKVKAVLVFSADLQKDLLFRGLSKKFSELIKIPFLTSKVTFQADIHIFTTSKNLTLQSKQTGSPNFYLHSQCGQSFSERLQNAVETLVAGGYQQIVVVGSDCPELQSRDISTAFEKLSNYDLVLGPDHRGGCYLIGFHSDQRQKLYGIQWQANTDCEELQQVFRTECTYLLSVKHDIDSITDVRILSHCKNIWGVKAKAILQENKSEHFAENSQQQIHLPVDTQRLSWQLPPPLSS